MPLLLWAPGLAPRPVAERVQHLDPLPTLLDLLGLPSESPSIAGRSYAAWFRGEAPAPPDDARILATGTLYGPPRRASIASE